MNAKLALRVAGTIFSVIAIIHLLRLLYHWDINIAGYNIPMWVSIAGMLVAGLLALWMFIAAKRT